MTTLDVAATGAAADAVGAHVPTLVADRVASRLFAKDHTLWGEAAESEAAKRLSWTGLHRTSRHLVQKLGREPMPEEIAERMDMPLDKVRKILKIAREPISLETPIGEEEDSHLGDFIEDKKAVSPLEAAIRYDLQRQINSALETLTPREEKVLRKRFGIGEATDHTLEEVGQDFEVTRERIRQIEAKALRKLRHPSRSKKLRSFVESL